jgi:hypothetical protein
MECINHSTIQAVGVCQVCGKPICLDCASQSVNGMACKASCESRFSDVYPGIDSPIGNGKPTSLQIKLSRIVVAMFCLAIIAVVFLPLFAEEPILGFVILGTIIVFYTAMRHLRRQRH